MKQYLLTWYGITDLRAALGLDPTDGPILLSLPAESVPVNRPKSVPPVYLIFISIQGGEETVISFLHFIPGRHFKGAERK
jgi:hypothetical protein